MESSPITREQVVEFMSRSLHERSELYIRIADELDEYPEGQVARWCQEIRRETRAQIDGVIDMATNFYRARS